MQSTLSLLTPVLVFSAPLLLWLVGLVPTNIANKHSRLMLRVYTGGAWLALFSALIAAADHIFITARSWTLLSIPLPGEMGAFSIGIYVNNVSLIMLALVSFVGVIVSRYSRNYLAGEVNQGRFYKWLTLTLASILTLIVSSNLLMFSLAWISTSLCLHQLLMFYRDRPAAALAAHKKFVASRLSDLSLLAAIFLIGSTLKTLEFEEMFITMAAMQGPLPLALHWAAILIVVSAALKSAQFPFHGWLIQVMEAPTPVSALLHAGIVNAGAFLVIRMSPIMSYSEIAMGLLAIVGLITLALASLVMLTQTSIKVSLAWSTTGQMGFMLLECGLGLYSLAMLHLVAHSLYKAHAFLASGSGVDAFRAPVVSYPSQRFHMGHSILTLVVAGLMTVGIGAAFGISLDQQPALIAAGAIVAIAVSQLLLQAGSVAGNAVFLLRVLGLSAIVSIVYFALHHVFELVISGSVIPMQASGSAFQSTLAIVITGVFLSLWMAQQAFKNMASPWKERLYIHLYNGLYIDVFITRILQRLWPSPRVDHLTTSKA
jgi:NAD(P)H-quinone oxidoreductase subunit 5